MTSPIQKVVIVGRDAAAWVSALTLQHSFGHGEKPIEITLVELPSQLRPADTSLTLPAQRAFHDLLGLDENRLLTASKGVYSLGQRFSNWSGPDSSFLHAYDTHGVSMSRVEFYQHWLRARASGMKVPLEEFSLGAVAARTGRFVVFNDATQGFSNASYGFNLPTIPWLGALGKAAIASGLNHVVGELASVQAENSRIKAVTLKNGETLEADLFVDTSGPEAILFRHLEATGNREDWSQWLPCDRTLVASAPPLKPIPSFNQVSSFRDGWVGIYPGVDRSTVMASYASSFVSDDEALHTAAVLSGLKLDDGAVADVVSPGARARQWIGNCVALGDTAVSIDQLDASQLHLLQSGLSYLVALFPVHADSMPEQTVFNEKMRSIATGVRDFSAAHFKLNRRFGEPLWDAVREAEPPASLHHKLRLFKARGMVALNEDETFLEENWVSLLNGHQLKPVSWDPLVERVPEHEMIENFQRILKFIATEVESLPSLETHIELSTPQQAPASDYIFG